MEFRDNKLKRSLRDGEVTLGIWNALVNPYVAELCAGAGYDWMVIDAEHGPFTLPDILQHIQAVSRFDIPVAVRVEENNAAKVKRVLDLGVQNLIFPMVNNTTEAEEAVKSTRYAPRGVRGVAPAMSRAAEFGDIKDYVKLVGDQMCVITQVETAESLEHIDEVCAIEEVDCLFIGPNDLATSLGYSGDFRHPDVENKILEALEKIRDNGKAAGILALEPDLASKYRDHGANMIGVGVDILLLKSGLKSNLEIFR